MDFPLIGPIWRNSVFVALFFSVLFFFCVILRVAVVCFRSNNPGVMPERIFFASIMCKLASIAGAGERKKQVDNDDKNNNGRIITVETERRSSRVYCCYFLSFFPFRFFFFGFGWLLLFHNGGIAFA